MLEGLRTEAQEGMMPRGCDVESVVKVWKSCAKCKVEAKRGLWCSTRFESVGLFFGLIANGGVAGKGGGEKENGGGIGVVGGGGGTGRGE